MTNNHHFISLDNLFTEEIHHLKIFLVTYLKNKEERYSETNDNFGKVII